MITSSFVLIALAAVSVLAHPGEHHSHEAIRREVHYRNLLASRAATSLAKCGNSREAVELNRRAVQRRAAVAERLRKERGIELSKPGI